jgi:hypothetical protein
MSSWISIADEARTLIQLMVQLMELRFDEWYVTRHVRGESLERPGVIAGEKKTPSEQKKLPPPET